MTLYEQLINGDEQAFQKLCNISQEMSRSVVRKFLNSWPTHSYLKDDLVSHATVVAVEILRGFQNGNRLKYGTNIESYLSFSIWTSLSDLIRSEQTILQPKGTRQYCNRADDDLDEMCSPLSDLEGEITKNELLESLLAACRNEYEDEVIRLKAEGRSDVEVSRITGIHRNQIARMKKEVYARTTNR